MGTVLKRAVKLVAVVVLCGLGFTAAASDEKRHGSEKGNRNSIVVGYSSRVFCSVDSKDVIALTKVWMELVDRKMNNPWKTNVAFFENIRELENALSAGEVDIAVLLPEELIHLRRRIPLVPVLSADYGKHFYDELVLLVRNDSGISDIRQLRNKRLRIQTGQKGTIPMRWLESVLAKKMFSDARGFFSTIQEADRASQVILPVFFGQADACLANQTEFETVAEMNPQISRRLRILERSPGYLTGVIAVRKDSTSERRNALLDAIQQLQSEPRGVQLLTLFRINRLIPFKAEHLASVEQLLKEHRACMEKVARGKH
jgi:ABC-type phosphate/phosphonate transport system substrate-binding protein